MRGSSPALCIIGPLTGRNGSVVTTQGEVLADSFLAAGYAVVSFSSVANRYRRLLDILVNILRHGRRFDIALIQTYGGPSFVVEDAASWLARSLGQRVVLHLRGGAMPAFMTRFPRWSRRVLGRADLLVVPSEYLRDAVRAVGFEARIIPNVIRTSAYRFRRRTRLLPRLLWMRAFEPLYNPLMAVRVLALVKAQYPDATLVMAGQDNGLRGTTQDEARRLGVAHAVRFTGFLNRAGKKREGELADIFINTNRVDNTPVSVIEACARGIPVVSTAVGGVPYLLRHGETGLLVPDDDAAAMSAAVIRLLKEPQLAQRLSDNGRQLAQRCEWDAVRPVWDEALSALIQNGHRT